MNTLRITADHLRILRQEEQVCVPGAQDWCTVYGIDFKDFLRYGLPAYVLEATDAHLAKRLIEIAQREADRGEE